MTEMNKNLGEECGLSRGDETCRFSILDFENIRLELLSKVHPFCWTKVENVEK